MPMARGQGPRPGPEARARGQGSCPRTCLTQRSFSIFFCTGYLVRDPRLWPYVCHRPKVLWQVNSHRHCCTGLFWGACFGVFVWLDDGMEPFCLRQLAGIKAALTLRRLAGIPGILQTQAFRSLLLEASPDSPWPLRSKSERGCMK